jgi:hypothetical protein
MKHNSTGSPASWLYVIPFFALSVATLATPAPMASEQPYLYQAMFVRAAPGRLLEMISLYQKRMPVYDASGDERPLWWRHTQGDQWDLMFLFPMGSYTEYFSPERLARRKKAGDSSPLPQEEFARSFYEYTAWHEDIYVDGPALETVKKAFNSAAYYHIEIFIALPGKQSELRKEREMENAYQKGIGRPETLIFTHDQGAAWDLFTLGCYRDLKHWAESSEVPKEKRDAAARAAGFVDADQIGLYMRTLISMHRDTMGVAIK